MRRIDQYRIKRNDNLGDPEFWNPRFEEIDLRLGLTEDKLLSLDAVADRMEAVALDRINTSITPLVIQTQQRIAAIPNLFSATSISSVAVETGAKTFFVEPSMRETFAVGGYVLARRVADASVWLSGALVSYTPSTGELVLDVDAAAGTGTFTDWRFYTAGRKGQKGDKGDRGATYRPGGYNPATAYAKDDMVSDQGSLWINIAGAGSTSIAPPVLPTTSNATWEVVALRPALASDVLYTWSEGVTKSLQAALDDFRAAVAASFGGVDDALDGKASLIHSHAIADVASLQAALDARLDKTDPDAALGVLGGTTVGKALFKAASAAAARTSMGGSATGQAVFTAADDVAARSAISAAPVPKTASGVGQYVFIDQTTAGQGYTLPAGGSWAWFAIYRNASGMLNGFGAFIDAGGTQIRPGVTGNTIGGFAWRIA